MTEAADRLLIDAAGHTLADPDETFEALAIRDGEIVRVGKEYEVSFLEGVETEVIDCEGRVVLPGFVDAHTHVENLGQYRIHADLSGAAGPGECIDRLRDRAKGEGEGEAETGAVTETGGEAKIEAAAKSGKEAKDETATDREWILGFGYDESAWDENRYLTRADLDRVSEERPVVAMRVDMHTASLNGVALERLRASMPDEDVEREDGEPTGVVVESAAEAVWDAVEPDYAETRDLVTAALEYANARGVTTVHDMVRRSHAPRVYRNLDAEGALTARVRLNYWSDHLESAIDAGLATNAGSEFVRTGAIKTFTDGSFGGRTAKLFEPYADAPGGDDETDGERDAGGDDGERDADGDGAAGDAARGQWVVDPDELRAIVDEADAHDLQVTAHAIGDEAIEETVAAYEECTDAGAARHRVEHAELATDDQIERMAGAGIVASVQPNFLRWADDGGLYDQRLGRARRERSNRFRAMLDAGVPLAFGSDCMPLDPLVGVDHAVNAPVEAQRLSVTEALRAYTRGAAYAGFDEDRLGTIEVGKKADLAVLEESPWERSDRIDEIDVALTLVDGEVVYDGR